MYAIDNETNEAVFHYPIDDLFNSTYRNTSYIAQGIKLADNSYALDALILTPKDKSIFKDLLFHEAARCYEPFIKFGRNTPNAYYISKEGSLLTLPTIDDITVTASVADETTITLTLSSALPSGLQLQVKVAYEYQVHDLLGDLVTRDGIYVCPITSANGTSKTFAPDCPTDTTNGGLGAESFVGITSASVADTDYTYLLSYTIHAGDIVKVTRGGKFYYYSVLADTNSGDLADKSLYSPIKGDYRNSLLVVMQMPHKFNHNMLSVIDSNLEQAIITGVVLRWYKMVGGTRLQTVYQQAVEDATAAYERLQDSINNSKANDKILKTRWF